MVEKVAVQPKKPEAKKESSKSIKIRTEVSQSLSTPADRILYLQRTIGNQAIQRLIKSGTLQAKLRIVQPGDVYEQEADRVADALMRMPEPQVKRKSVEEEEEEQIQTKPIIEQITPLVQRQIDEEKEEEELRKQPIEEEEELQAKVTSCNISEINPNLESHIKSLKGSGQPLSKNNRTFFEPRLGYDFDQVRVHTDSKAVEAARSVNAKAFTIGRDVVFGSGQYSPDTFGGRQLLGHELTHVIQQEGSHIGQFNDKTSVCDRVEQESSSVEQVISYNQPIPTISESIPSSTIAGIFYLSQEVNDEVGQAEVVWVIDYDQRQERIVAWIDVIRGEGGEVSEISPQQRVRIGRETTLSASDIEVRLGLPSGTLIAEEHNPVEGAVYFGILNPEVNIPLLRRQIGAIEAREISQFRVPGEGVLPGPVTNNPDALVPASLEMLFHLYATQQPRYRLMPARIVFSRDWVMSDTGTALLRGTIRWKLMNRLGQLGQRQHLLSYVDDRVRGSEHRKDELIDIINETFDRVAELGLARAQRTAPTLVDIGRRGRTWTRRRAELAHLTMHAAMDVFGPEGTGIYSPLEGRVVYRGQSSTYGNLVRILHESPPPTTAAEDAHGRSIVWRGPVVTSYAHLLELLVSTGDQVRSGQAVGTMGATGIPGMLSHLHFSVMRAPGGRVTRLTSETEENPMHRIRPDTWLHEIGRVSIFETYYPLPTRRRRR